MDACKNVKMINLFFTSSGKFHQLFGQSGREQQSLSGVRQPADDLLKLIGKTHFKQPEQREKHEHINKHVRVNPSRVMRMGQIGMCAVPCLTCQPHQTPRTPHCAASGSSPWQRAWDDPGCRWFCGKKDKSSGVQGTMNGCGTNNINVTTRPKCSHVRVFVKRRKLIFHSGEEQRCLL